MELKANENSFENRLEAIVKSELCALLLSIAGDRERKEAELEKERLELEMAAEVEFQIENQKTFGGWA